MRVKLLASASAIFLLIAITALAVSLTQGNRATESPPEAAAAPSDQATIGNDMVQAPHAGQDLNAADPLSTPDLNRDPISPAPAPVASSPKVMPEAAGVADSDQVSPPAPADGAFAAVESRRPPSQIQPNRPPSRVELNAVALAQTQLNALGYRAGPADGIVGPRTTAAIRRFQTATGLPVDGRMSDPLIAALRRQSTKSNLQTQGR